jgi:DNA-binding transcriptional LysR family regulator
MTTILRRRVGAVSKGTRPRNRSDRGDLVQVLPETERENPGLYLYYPRRASRAPKLRAFVDTAREVLSL